MKMPENAIITINEGRVRGIKKFSKFSKTEYYSFFGIPYGKPPVGSHRFQDPVKTTPWTDIFDATNEKEGCIQFSMLAYKFLGTEDCLFNNIHTPKIPQKNETLRPVIVSIHPGAYRFGSPHTQFYGSPEFIMHNDVVYVCISYRLHILGYLNLNLKECSGNQALKDIILSLQWIKNNIRSFGGDPDNITLIGSSSGSTLTQILLLSPSTRGKGLFHKAVLMGGHLTNPVIPHQKTNENHAREIAKTLGYDGDLLDNEEVLIFLREQDPLSLIEGFRRCEKNLHQSIAPVIPICVFNPSLDQSGILPDLPKNLIKSMARIPIMIGFSQIESIMGFVRGLRPSTEKNFKGSLRQNYFGWGYHLNNEEIESIYKEVDEFYLHGQPLEEAPLSTKMDIQTDIALSDIYETIINPISKDLPSSVFVYKFEFEGNIFSMNTSIKEKIDEPIKGTCHASDFCYWNRVGDPRDEEARQMVETFTRLVTTFAKKGDPNYENLPFKWRSSNPDKPCYLNISNSITMVDGKLNNDRMEFWEKIQKKNTKSDCNDQLRYDNDLCYNLLYM